MIALTSRNAVPPAKTHLLGPESSWMVPLPSTGPSFQHSGESPSTTRKPCRCNWDGTVATGSTPTVASPANCCSNCFAKDRPARTLRFGRFEADYRRTPNFLTPEQVAQLLGVTRSWVYQHQDELPFTRLGSGPKAILRMDRTDLRAYLLRDRRDAACTDPQRVAEEASMSERMTVIGEKARRDAEAARGGSCATSRARSKVSSTRSLPTFLGSLPNWRSRNEGRGRWSVTQESA